MLKNDIVISGYSCRLPESDRPSEFWKNLIDGRDMITADDRRWPAAQFDTPARFGKIKDLSRFDARFFGVHAKQAHKLDPQLRMLLEVAYEAIKNAGFNAEELRGGNAGVFVGACVSDADALFCSRPESMTGYENTGCSTAMFANRLSYSFDFHGPSMTIDTACSSSLVALDLAVRALTDGDCDYALVAGANLVLRPGNSVGFAKLKMLAPDGACRSFDADGAGYARADGVVAILLTRAGLARRVIASVLGSGVNSDGYTEQGITFPSREAQQRLLESVYARAGVAADSVTYIETHGTGTPAGDPQEAEALCGAFRPQLRSGQPPLLIGSVKSNMGHAEGAAGLAGILKVLLAMEHKTLPANLHFHNPNPDIAALTDGRLQVVTQTQPWPGGIVGVNSFGFGGTNAHVVLRDEIAAQAVATGPATLIPCASRTESGLDDLLRLASSEHLGDDQAALLRSVANAPPATHPWRGCVLRKSSGLATTGAANIADRPPVWFVFSGMGAQWPGMGRALLSLAPFRAALERCQQALTGTGLDLFEIIGRDDAEVYADVTRSFVVLTAVQIGLTDVLRHAGIAPDGIIGHSVGEIAAAYADGALDTGQAILAAYWRGRCVAEQPTSRGKMLVVPTDWDSAATLCPEGIERACDNGARSVTLSGDADAADRLLAELVAQGIDARAVNSSHIAFHAAPIRAAAPALLRALTGIIADPKPRSARWISTSGQQEAATCTAEYFVNNLCNPVRFRDAVAHIPSGSMIIEVGAHTLMRLPLTETHPDCHYTGLMYRGRDNQDDLMEGLARCYTRGLDLDWDALFPVAYPLTTACGVEEVVAWDHSQAWEVPSFAEYGAGGGTQGETRYQIDLRSEEYAYIADHNIAGKVVFPGVGYLHLVWQTLARQQHTPLNSLPVQFSEVRFHRATPVPDDDVITFSVRYLPGSARFEVVNDGDLVASGQVVAGDQVVWPEFPPARPHQNTAALLRGADLYKELRLRGYQYGPAFTGITELRSDGRGLRVAWNGNWVGFLDTLLQTTTIALGRQTLVPVYIRRFSIDPRRMPDDTEISAAGLTAPRRVVTPAAVLEDCRAAPLSVIQHAHPATLLSYEFVPHSEDVSPGGERADEYIRLLTDFITASAHAVLAAATQRGHSLPTHLERLRDALAGSPTTMPDPARLAAYADERDASFLRMVRHFTADPEAMLNEPMSRIVAYEEYAQVYRTDPAAANLFTDRCLGGLFDLVLENRAHDRPVRLCEIGAGTGGITSHLLPRLRSRQDRYIVSDISAGFFERLRKEFADYSAVTQYATWDVGLPAPAAIGDALDLVVASNVLHAAPNLRVALANIRAALADGGFLMLHELTHGSGMVLGVWGFSEQLWRYDDPQDRGHGALLSRRQWEALLERTGFDVVAVKDDGSAASLFLCRKQPQAAPKVQRLRLSGDVAADLPALQAALVETAADPNARLWLEADADGATGLIGMVNCLRKEPGGGQVRGLYADRLDAVSDGLRERMERLDLAVNVVRDGQWGSFRHLALAAPAPVLTDNVQFTIGAKGDLSSLRWWQAPRWKAEHPHIQAHYLSLNFKDVMLATGKLRHGEDSADPGMALGVEFAGVSDRGRRVMGFLSTAFTSKICAGDYHPPFLLDVPEHWSLEQAATVPVVYMTAYLALVLRGRLRAGERVLIHSGTGGVGQAAIRVALSLGCEVFTTVGSDEKRTYLKTLFPTIADDHIGNSRDTSFEDLVMQATDGQGVNAVLNSLADDKLQASLRVLARYGRFLEVGKYDMTRDTGIGMAMFLQDIAFHGVGLDGLSPEHSDEPDTLARLLRDGIRTGVIQPLERRVFTPDRLEEAFRHMARGRHVGKVVIDLRDDSGGAARAIPAGRKFWCDPSKCYVITGGLGGVGLELAEWLVERGARHLVLTSRNGVRSGYQAYRIETWQRRGVDVAVSLLDVSDAGQAGELIRDIEARQSIGAIFHLGMVIADALLANQTPERFGAALGVKMDGARHLDRLSRTHCQALDQFVVFSSIVAGYGNGGQSNYAYANSAMERLCESRQRDGLPATAIQWGPIADVGFVEENRGQVRQSGLWIQEQSIHSCLAALEQLLLQPAPVVTSIEPDQDFRAEAGVAGDQPRLRRGRDGLLAAVKGILGLQPADEVDGDATLNDLGLDSLMAVEVQHVLGAEFDITVSLPEVRALTLAGIAARFDAHTGRQDMPAVAGAASGRTQTGAEAVFEKYRNGGEDGEAVYFVSGFMADPHAALDQAGGQEHGNVYIVRYERAASMEELAGLWVEHMRALPAGSERIRIVGHSIGATIAHRFMKLAELGELRERIELMSISPPRSDLIGELDDIEIADIDHIPDAQGLNILKRSKWYGDFPILSMTELRKQAKFILTSRVHELELGRADTVVLPMADPICWSEDEARLYATTVLRVQGRHDFRSVQLGPLMARARGPRPAG